MIWCSLNMNLIFNHARKEKKLYSISTSVARNYLSLDKNELPEHVTKCLKFLQSDAMFLMLSSLTGLKLHELAEVSDSEEESEQTDNRGRQSHAEQVG